MVDNVYRHAVEAKVLADDRERTSHPLKVPAPKRPREVVMGGTLETGGSAPWPPSKRTKIRTVPLKELEAAVSQFESEDSENDARLKKGFVKLAHKEAPVAIQYVYHHGQIKIRAKFKGSGEFVDWLFVCKSRMLESKGIHQLGLYADRVIPGGMCLGVLTGRVIGPHLPSPDDKQADPERVDAERDGLRKRPPNPAEPLTRLRHAIMDILGCGSMVFQQVVDGGPARGRLDVDGSRPGLGFGLAPGNTFWVNGMPCVTDGCMNKNFDYPGLYLHMANDPRGFDELESRPNAMHAEEFGGLVLQNTVYPHEEIVWWYDTSASMREELEMFQRNDHAEIEEKRAAACETAVVSIKAVLKDMTHHNCQVTKGRKVTRRGGTHILVDEIDKDDMVKVLEKLKDNKNFKKVKELWKNYLRGISIEKKNES
eukprot:jgi/Mesvir1/24022/Mv10764-RA.1